MRDLGIGWLNELIVFELRVLSYVDNLPDIVRVEFVLMKSMFDVIIYHTNGRIKKYKIETMQIK